MNVGTSTPDLTQPSATPRAEGILSPTYRAATLGMVALISLLAFEALAVTTAMPTVARELDGLRAYALAFGGMLATSVIGMALSGRWSDRKGPAPAVWTGLIGFVAGLLIAGFAHNMPTLLIGRLVQGLGAGCLSPALYVIVARLYPESLRPKVFASFSAGWVVPALIGPAISGAIVEHVGWRWVFLAVPVLALPAAAALRGALGSLAPPTHVHDDKPGRMLNAVGASLGTCLLFVAGQEQGWLAAALFVPAVALLIGCGHRLLPAGTLRAARGLPAVIALRGIAASAFFGAEAFLPLVFSQQHGLSPTWSGIGISVGAIGWFSGSWYQGHYAKISRQSLLTRGTALMVLGVTTASLATFEWMPVTAAVAGWLLTGLGMGMLYGTVAVLALSMSGEHEQGSNSSALQLCESLMVATTLAIGGTLFAALLNVSHTAAFAANFAITVALAVLGTIVARRTQTPA
ncbi:MFS transporter [Luteibacter rhizovicinus DSM 16549]|uniref:MFS transporter n=1 Tax=Luteibacter rhizovicinus DSM 16549 TaxID=1440763 RepID=A0A0G9HDA1_9GAMM|nr:MFS transporter [Luteibacter rhizovicinus]APG02459.1 MFS transporter [Luteibacter rhizovicinus DSM 16549]KLD65692.1 MFS transporter [Luteibacter rhizovicinus DSM 16549]KLD75570.1 MFS transporter [Xanthomonas hyacinthi DSM 19077]